MISTRIFFLVQKKVLQLSDRVIVFSDYSKKIVIEHFNVLPEKIFKVSPQLITPQNQKQKLLPEYFIQKNKSFILLVPSRIEPRKGLMILLESLLYLKKISNYKFDLFFTGEINNEQYAKEMFIFCKMNNLVEAHFINSVDKERLYELYKASDLVCMPSLKLETFGLVTLESISQGTPVVSFDTGATTELLSKIDKRLIASDVTAASLADTILWYFQLSSTDKTRLRKKCKVFFSKYKCSKNTFLSLYYK